MPGQAGQGITNRSKVARKLTHPLSGIVSVLSVCMSIALRHIIDGCDHCIANDLEKHTSVLEMEMEAKHDTSAVGLIHPKHPLYHGQ